MDEIESSGSVWATSLPHPLKAGYIPSCLASREGNAKLLSVKTQRGTENVPEVDELVLQSRRAEYKLSSNSNMAARIRGGTNG